MPNPTPNWKERFEDKFIVNTINPVIRAGTLAYELVAFIEEVAKEEREGALKTRQEEFDTLRDTLDETYDKGIADERERIVSILEGLKKSVRQLFPDANIKIASVELAEQVITKNVHNQAIDSAIQAINKV